MQENDSLIQSVAGLVRAQIQGASEESRLDLAAKLLHCDHRRAQEVADLAIGAIHAAIRSDEGEDPIAVWNELGGPQIGKDLILQLVKAAMQEINNAENSVSEDDKESELSPEVADALEATYKTYLQVLPLLRANKDLSELATAIVPAATDREKEALEVARQFKLVYKLSEKVVNQTIKPEDADIFNIESDGVFLLFQRVVQDLLV